MLYFENVSVLPKKGRGAIFTSYYHGRSLPTPREHSKAIYRLINCQRPHVVTVISIHKGKNSLSQLSCISNNWHFPSALEMSPHNFAQKMHTEESIPASAITTLPPAHTLMWAQQL